MTTCSLSSLRYLSLVGLLVVSVGLADEPIYTMDCTKQKDGSAKSWLLKQGFKYKKSHFVSNDFND